MSAETEEKLASLMLYLIKEDADQILTLLQNLPSGSGGAGGSGGSGGVGYPNNTQTGQIVVITTGAITGFTQGPSMVVPNGFKLVIKSHPSNPPGSLVYVAFSGPGALNQNAQYPLVPNETVGYGVTNGSAVWVAGSQPGLLVIFSSEMAP